MWECSTFNVHLRWLLIKLGRGSGPLFVANGITMMVVFFCCRIVWGYTTSVQVRPLCVCVCVCVVKERVCVSVCGQTPPWGVCV